jgi:hypothetical protein
MNQSTISLFDNYVDFKKYLNHHTDTMDEMYVSFGSAIYKDLNKCERHDFTQLLPYYYDNNMNKNLIIAFDNFKDVDIEKYKEKLSEYKSENTEIILYNNYVNIDLIKIIFSLSHKLNQLNQHFICRLVDFIYYTSLNPNHNELLFIKNNKSMIHQIQNQIKSVNCDYIKLYKVLFPNINKKLLVNITNKTQQILVEFNYKYYYNIINYIIGNNLILTSDSIKLMNKTDIENILLYNKIILDDIIIKKYTRICSKSFDFIIM